ncbi:elongation factor P maturation arginine rhamnosyltransferase EarP [Mariprofundus erugo]|uniref:elongation factor P maturation arginine rhamnosyltransferase EarP n=1 Tax=Mariprofundus erugo TaxID=2528639 RepID=UPI0010FF5FB7|nr:elongation factor P maturation arginine rhamnosyltransferase EarP [Mariprofundus erugo]TLS77855.1 elongation factor P maturation arginine rhamnosyltransferase EarP [Mariprofundus erugo]
MSSQPAVIITSPPSWDIFCNVIDNYGDIGVCWRLARQLAGEYGLSVRLWVDDLASFVRLHPSADAQAALQWCCGVQVCHWSQSFAGVQPATVVIEGFGCQLPASYLQAMETSPPVWINLEYLSAESWVEGCHGLPSPVRAMIRYFYFPGFVPATGGLLLESGLLARRDAFCPDVGAKSRFWHSLGMLAPDPDTMIVSLFCYENGNVPELFEAWAGGTQRMLCLVPEGRVLPQVAAWFGDAAAAAGSRYVRGMLEVQVLPFVSQQQYDQLLWLCDLNFVRGEDSMVRAQWAAKPMLWHIYPQQDMAHWPKLEAFIDRYCALLSHDDAMLVRHLMEAWNRGCGAGPLWQQYMGAWPRLHAHAGQWCRHLCEDGGGSLAANLVDFSRQIMDSAAPNLRGG